MVREVTREELVAAHCWEPDDRVPRDPAMTAFRRSIRYHQACWREAHGHPIGTQPIAPRPGDDRVRLVGSRMPLDLARTTGANFVTPTAFEAARLRAATAEPRQTFDHRRLWADLLSSTALSFNLFGDLAADGALATRAVRSWWPDAPGTVTDVRFAHSPGRLDDEYLANLRTFDTAFVLEVGDGSYGAVGIVTKYGEWAKPETPRPSNMSALPRGRETIGCVPPGALDVLRERSELAEIWLEHLLLHSMLQHPSRRWRWGRYVVVYPAGNTHIAGACARYEAHLTDRSTFSTTTLETLLDDRVLPRATATALRQRYLTVNSVSSRPR